MTNKFEPVLLDQISLKRALKFKTVLEEGYVYVTTRNTYWVWLPYYKVWVKRAGGRVSIATFSYKKSTVSKQNPDGLSLKADLKEVDKEERAAMLDNHERIVRKYGLDEHPRLKVDEEPEVVEKPMVEITAEEFVGIPEPGVEITEKSTPDDFDAEIWRIVQSLAESSSTYNAKEWAEQQLIGLGVKPPTREVLIRVTAPTTVSNDTIIDALTSIGVTVIEID